MKISNLILTFILALAVSFTISGQTNSHVITIENDGESIYLRLEDDEVVELKVDGEVIEESAYSDYRDIINRYSRPSRVKNTPIPPTPPCHKGNNLQPRLLSNLKDYFVEKGMISPSKYELKLTHDYVKVNGKKMNDETLEHCLQIFKETSGSKLHKGSYFHVSVSPNSRSISMNIED